MRAFVITPQSCDLLGLQATRLCSGKNGTRLRDASVRLLGLPPCVQRVHRDHVENLTQPVEPVLLGLSLVHCCKHMLLRRIQELVRRRVGEQLVAPDRLHNELSGSQIFGKMVHRVEGLAIVGGSFPIHPEHARRGTKVVHARPAKMAGLQSYLRTTAKETPRTD